MGLARIDVALRRSNVAPNPQDRSAIALVVGPSSKGVLNKPLTFTSLAQIAELAGDGPGAELAGAILGVAGGPVHFCPSAKSTPGASGSVTKVDPAAAVGTAQFFGGELILPSANQNGLEVIAKVAGVTLTVVVAGNNTSLSVPALGAGVKDIVVNSATDGGGVATSTATLIAAAMLAEPTVAALVAANVLGTGATVVGALAQTALDKGSLNITPKAQGVRVKFQVSGNNTALDATASGSDLTIVLATNGNGLPTSTASAVKTKIEAVAGAAALVSAALVGDGTGLAGRAAAFLALQFGSTGAMSVSTATANDSYSVTCEVLRAGTVGGATNPTFRWSADGVLFSGEILIPANGIVALKDSYLDTGLAVTFSGALSKGDKFTFSTTAPRSSVSDVIAAIDGALADSSRQWGFVTSPESFSKASVALLDGKLQSVWQSRFARGMWSARDIAEGVPNETRQQWADSLTNDFAGFVSGSNSSTEAGGLVDVAAAPVLHLSPLSLRQFRRAGTFASAVRKASIPAHEDLGKTKTGPLKNILAIYSDEAVTPQLAAQRFLTTRTYDARPGAFFLTDAVTMADSSNVAYSLVQWVGISLSIARIAKEAAFDFLRDSLQGTGAADQGSPAGALSTAERGQIETLMAGAITKFLFSVKSDGKQSASAYVGGEKPVEVTAANNFLEDRTVNIEVGWRPMGVAEIIKIGVQSKLGA